MKKALWVVDWYSYGGIHIEDDALSFGEEVWRYFIEKKGRRFCALELTP